MIKNSGSIGRLGGGMPVTPTASSPSGKFEKILGEKTVKREDIKAGSPPTAEQTKEKLRVLLEGGANPDEIVRTALAGHPLVDDLPVRLKEQLVKNVTATVSPTLKGKDQLRRT
ncbi:MAG: hypothetical protein HY541_08110 [Deltaproteobacteria bacterium]|nr:hypothetical protein [Deltaproteobacteria bacterium]